MPYWIFQFFPTTFCFVSFRFVWFRFVFSVTFRFVSLHFVSFRYISFRSVSFCFISFRFFRYISFRFISFRSVSFCLISFRFVRFRFVSFRFYFVSHFTGTPNLLYILTKIKSEKSTPENKHHRQKLLSDKQIKFKEFCMSWNKFHKNLPRDGFKIIFLKKCGFIWNI
jgi:hypothetical protein